MVQKMRPTPAWYRAKVGMYLFLSWLPLFLSVFQRTTQRSPFPGSPGAPFRGPEEQPPSLFGEVPNDTTKDEPSQPVGPTERPISFASGASGSPAIGRLALGAPSALRGGLHGRRHHLPAALGGVSSILVRLFACPELLTLFSVFLCVFFAFLGFPLFSRHKK